MPDSEYVLRVHPAIGIARVGNSEDYYLAPETVAGVPVDGPGSPIGGLPIQAGSESQTIRSGDLRDKYGRMKRQAARFRIFSYPPDVGARYPAGAGEEIRIGSMLGDKKVVDVVWTVHLANKKANSYVLNDDLGIDPNNSARIKKLVIDAGPRAIRGLDDAPVPFDKSTHACYGHGNDIVA